MCPLVIDIGLSLYPIFKLSPNSHYTFAGKELNMKRIALLLTFSVWGVIAYGQGQEHSLSYYMEAAKRNSPLLNDYRNQMQMEQDELQRLKAMYRHSRLEVNGDYLFVPIVSKDGGRTSFQWNAHNATDYYGYDLGESSGFLHAGVTWTQPLLGKSSYKVAQEQSRINTEIIRNHIRLEEHQLERTVTEQYLLCLLDQTQAAFADSVGAVLMRQEEIVGCLVKNGLTKESDLQLLAIEREANEELRLSSLQSYHTHLMDLNLLCSIEDTANVALANIGVKQRTPDLYDSSLFTEQYRLDSLNTVASLRSFNLQYKPRLDLFVNGGMQVSDYAGWYRHFGMSAGLTFRWTIFDGRQKRWKEHQAERQQQSIQAYKENAEYQRQMRIRQCLSELDKYDQRAVALERQLARYDEVLSAYAKEVEAGQMSVLDYITVLRNKIQAERDCLLLNTNRQLVVATYNYWNY